MLDEFRKIDIRLDKANAHILPKIFVKQGDHLGRDIVVQVTNGGKIDNQTGVGLQLGWRHKSVGNSGLEPFEIIDITKGIYKVSCPTELTNPGEVEASIIIIEGLKVTQSRNFIITVESSPIDNAAIQSDNNFSALQSAIAGIANLEETYAPRLTSVETTAAQAAVDVDGVTHDTLKARIDNDVVQLNAEINEAKTSQNREAITPLVSFLSDDTPIEDYDIFKPIAELTGVPFTLAAITNETYETPILLQEANVAKLHELVDVYGYEVCSHTVDHINLSTLSYAEQDYQLRVSKEQLAAKGFYTDSIAFPYGGYNADTLDILPKYYSHAYRAGTNALNDSPIDTYLINRIQFDPSNPNNTLEWYKAKVDEAVAKKRWVIFMLHCGPWLDWMLPEQQQMLVDLINYTKSLNVEIVTCRDAYDRFKNVYETKDGEYRIGAKANIMSGKHPFGSYNYDHTVVTAETPLTEFLEGVSYRTFSVAESQPFPENMGGALITHNYGSLRYEHSWQEWHPHNTHNVYWRESDATGTTWGAWVMQNGAAFIYQDGMTTSATLPHDYAARTTTIEQLGDIYIDTSGYPFNHASMLITTVGQSNDYVQQELKERYGRYAYRVGIQNAWTEWKYVNGNEVYNTSLTFGTITAQGYVDKVITFAGVTIDDAAIANPKTTLPGGLVFNALITTDDTITIRVTNVTAAPIVDTGRNWNVRVMQSY